MVCVEWRQEFLVGVEEVDGQHRHLFAMLATLRDAIEQQADYHDLLVILNDLVVYLREHFSCEQALLHSHPRWAEHHRQHWRFTEKVLYFLREYKRLKGSNGNTLAVEIYDFLCDWLQAHIVAVDRCYFAELDAAPGPGLSNN